MKSKLIFILFLLGTSTFLSGQGSDSTTRKIKDTIRIYYDVNLQVDTAERVYRLAPKDVLSREVKVTPRKYSSKQFDVTLKEENPRVKIYPIKGQSKDEFSGGLIKLGYGVLYTSPYVEGFYNSTKNKDFSYGVYYHHFSSAKED